MIFHVVRYSNCGCIIEVLDKDKTDQRGYPWIDRTILKRFLCLSCIKIQIDIIRGK